MTKPAILHICLSQGWGGLEMYPIRTGKQFSERGYSVYGLCVSGTQVAQGMRDAGIETFEIRSKGKLIFSELFKLNKWLEQKDVSIIHCHKSGDILISALLNLMSKRKAFFTEHMGVTRPKKDLYHKWVYSHLNQVFSISDETYQRNIKSLPVIKEKISRLWLGTDIPLAPIEDQKAINLIKDELSMPQQSVIIGNVGRVCPGKGQMELLEAFALLHKKYPTLQLLLVGGLDVTDGSDNDFVKQLKARIAELNLTDRVHLTGFRKDTERMLAAMDIVCLPNHNEAFGLTAIEAMAAKKPIVAANTGALPEILISTALQTDPLDPQKIANNIEHYLIDNELMNKNSNLAYQRVQSEFSMNAHIEKLAKHYHHS
ncbi:glycosyltransferase family 4 protein [Vibrio sp. Isolate23]|uniref:glycosyltransferase family 4 protein n=1 Tax=Vibrio sp. Isolate23 TaxID=2908533 RepID=UPI001EFE78B6|nr:glycosyltransferase family 4 protein [Vibrio sp. Isolate23]